MIAACPACGATSSRPLLRRTNVPVHQNRLAASAAEARAATRGDIELHGCLSCALVFNAAFDASRLRYDGDYVNDQTASPLFAAHVEERVRALVAGGVRGRTVLEIGCGNGEFLRRLCRTGQNRGIGFDTAAAAEHTADGAGVTLAARHYEETDRELGVDVAVARHTLEHVADPVALLRTLRSAVEGAPAARVDVELPALEWIGEQSAVWDVFYEHSLYFTATALENAFGLAALRVASMTRVFGGQYVWATAVPAARVDPRPPQGGERAMIDSLAAAETDVSRWRERIAAFADDGPVAVWGAGAKGATFLHLVDPRAESVSCVVDVHPTKQGRYVAGSGHAIVAPESEAVRAARHVVVMNPNYRDEVAARLAALGLAPELHTAEPVTQPS